MDAWLKPMLASPIDAVPEGPEWALEPKIDGWRAVISSNNGTVCLFGGRNGQAYTGQAPAIEAWIADTLPDGIVLDGELMHAQGWGGVQQAMTSRYGDINGELSFVAFDLLQMPRVDLRGLAYDERRALLEELLRGAGAKAPVQLIPSTDSSQAAHDAMLRMGMEGSVVKRRTSTYTPGRRSHDWGKVKATDTDEAIVTGFKAGTGRLAGKVGAFEVEMVASGAKTTVKCGTDERHQEATDHPELWLGTVIEITHNGLGATGVPRHPRFFRRRDDRTAEEQVAPTPRKAPTRPRSTGGGSGRTRNYGAMGDAKLRKVRRELEEGGDAYHRCINGGSGDPARDIAICDQVLADRRLLV